MTQKSKNHICWNNGMEILTGPERKYLFMADPASPIECTGNRECVIFYCMVEHWNTKTAMGKIFPVLQTSGIPAVIDADTAQTEQRENRLSLRRMK